MKHCVWISLILGLACLFSCTKESTDLSFEVVPRIEIQSVSSDSILEFEELLTLRLYYEDGDGDLGNPDPDVNSIFVQDERLEAADAYYLAPLAPTDASISIKGVLDIQLSGTFLLGNGTAETTRYTIYVVDRAGNISNSVKTDGITIYRE